MTELLVAMAGGALAGVFGVWYGVRAGRRQRGRAITVAHDRVRLLELHSEQTRADVQKMLRAWVGGAGPGAVFAMDEWRTFLESKAAVARDFALDLDGNSLENTADVRDLTRSELEELRSVTERRGL